MATEDRASILASIARGHDKRETEQYTVEDDIRTLKGVTVAPATYRERLQAIDMINRLVGDYDRAGQAVKVEAEEWRKLCRDTFGSNGVAKDQGARKDAIQSDYEASEPIPTASGGAGIGSPNAQEGSLIPETGRGANESGV